MLLSPLNVGLPLSGSSIKPKGILGLIKEQHRSSSITTSLHLIQLLIRMALIHETVYEYMRQRKGELYWLRDHLENNFEYLL